MTRPDARTGEIRPLTSLRMIAALLVFLHHFYPFDAPHNLLWIVSRQGNMGVSLFFTLSGFLIGLRYWPRFAAYGLDAAYLRGFFVKRFTRVYPLYAFIAVVALVFNPQKTVNLVTGFIHLTLTQSYFLTLPVQLVPTAWSLSVEVGFYLLVPFVLVSAVRAARWGVFAVAGVLAAWTFVLLTTGIGLRAASVATGAANWRGYGWLPTAGAAIEWMIFGRFAEFAAGLLTAFIYTRTTWADVLYRGRRGAVLSTALTVLAAAGMLAAFVVAAATDAVQVEQTLYLYFVVTAALTSLLILSLISQKNPLAQALAWGPFVYLGQVSYALYLMQMTVLMDLARLPLLAWLGETPPLWLYLPLLYLGGNAVSAALYEWVEVPARRWLLARSTQSSGHTVPVTAEQVPAKRQ